MKIVKRITTYTALALVLYVLFYRLHAFILESSETETPFSLFAIYSYQVIASWVLVVVFELLASLTTQFEDQLGFLYLASMAIKIMLFCIIFRGFLFSTIALSKVDSVSLLVPIFIFLFYEALIIVKILNRSTQI